MLDILIINHPKHCQVRWYFESSVDDEPTDFLKAKALAQDLGIYEGEEREDIITEFWEFENAMREDGLIPQEDELTTVLKDFIEYQAGYDAATKAYNAANDLLKTASLEVSKAVVKLGPLLKGKTKIVDGVAYSVRHDGYQYHVVTNEVA